MPVWKSPEEVVKDSFYFSTFEVVEILLSTDVVPTHVR